VDKLLEAIGVILAWPDKKEAQTTFHEKAQSVAQHFIDMGHGIERENSKETIRLATEAKTKAEGDLTTANQTIETLRKDKPDIAAMQQNHATELQNQQTRFDKEKKELKDFARGVLLERDLGKIRNRLVEEYKVNPSVADLIVKDEDLRDRIKHDDKGLTTVFQAGTRTPYVVASGQEWFHPVAEELKAKVPPRGFDTDADEGTGSSGHGTQSGGGGEGKGKGGKGNVFDQIRTQTEEQVKTKTGTSTAEVRQKKLRGTAPAR
jgi:hypothetical protein